MCEPSRIFECQAPYQKIRKESFPKVTFFNQIELGSAQVLTLSGSGGGRGLRGPDDQTHNCQ